MEAVSGAAQGIEIICEFGSFPVVILCRGKSHIFQTRKQARLAVFDKMDWRRS